jgi:Cell wall-active antibiotics response 4TMS YvqF
LFDHLGIGIDGDVLLPFILIGIGAAVLMSTRSPSGSAARAAAPDDTFSDLTFSHTDLGASGGSDNVIHEFDNVIDEFDLLRAPRAHEFEAGHLLSPKAPPAPTQTLSGPVSRRARRPRTPFVRSAFGMLMVSLGLLFVAAQIGFLNGRIDRVLACALFIIGLFLTLGAWLGRPRGFVTVGVLLTTVLAVFSVSGTTWQGGFGERSDSPMTIQDVRPSYRLAGGAMHLDFSHINFSGQRKAIKVDVSAGALAIEVPENVRVVTTGSSGFGEMTLFGQRWSGTDVHRQVTEEGTEGTLELDVHMGFGALEVARAGKLLKLRDLPSGTKTSILKDRAK